MASEESPGRTLRGVIKKLRAYDDSLSIGILLGLMGAVSYYQFNSPLDAIAMAWLTGMLTYVAVTYYHRSGGVRRRLPIPSRRPS